MKIEPFETYTQRYEDWFDKNRFAYESELQAVRAMLPKEGIGVEIGVGSAKFAAPLSIKYGVEPSAKMREIARKRGIKVVNGIAENLPYGGSKFDYVLMVTTLCFLDDVNTAFREVHRVLKPEGYFISGFVDRDSKIGKIYEEFKRESVFYRIAEFYSAYEVVKNLEEAGFKNFEFNQTIFHSLQEIQSIEPVKSGYGKGSFVVIKAKKEGRSKTDIYHKLYYFTYVLTLMCLKVLKG